MAKAEFEKAAHKVDSTILKVIPKGVWNENLGYYYFDFKLRVVLFKDGDAKIIIPFSQMDPDVLEEQRQELIAKGGNPPPLSTVPSRLDKQILPRLQTSGEK